MSDAPDKSPSEEFLKTCCRARDFQALKRVLLFYTPARLSVFYKHPDPLSDFLNCRILLPFTYLFVLQCIGRRLWFGL